MPALTSRACASLASNEHRGRAPDAHVTSSVRRAPGNESDAPRNSVDTNDDIIARHARRCVAPFNVFVMPSPSNGSDPPYAIRCFLQSRRLDWRKQRTAYGEGFARCLSKETVPIVVRQARQAMRTARTSTPELRRAASSCPDTGWPGASRGATVVDYGVGCCGIRCVALEGYHIASVTVGCLRMMTT